MKLMKCEIGEKSILKLWAVDDAWFDGIEDKPSINFELSLEETETFDSLKKKFSDREYLNEETGEVALIGDFDYLCFLCDLCSSEQIQLILCSFDYFRQEFAKVDQLSNIIFLDVKYDNCGDPMISDIYGIKLIVDLLESRKPNADIFFITGYPSRVQPILQENKWDIYVGITSIRAIAKSSKEALESNVKDIWLDKRNAVSKQDSSNSKLGLPEFLREMSEFSQQECHENWGLEECPPIFNLLSRLLDYRVNALAEKIGLVNPNTKLFSTYEEHFIPHVLQCLGCKDTSQFSVLAAMFITWAAYRKDFPNGDNNEKFETALKDPNFLQSEKSSKWKLSKNSSIVTTRKREKIASAIVAFYDMISNLIKADKAIEGYCNLGDDLLLDIKIDIKNGLEIYLNIPPKNLSEKVERVSRKLCKLWDLDMEAIAK
jgi:hypothetical protein